MNNYRAEIEAQLLELCPWLPPSMSRFYAYQFLKNIIARPPSHPNCRSTIVPPPSESPFREGEIVEECEHCHGWGYLPHQH